MKPLALTLALALVAGAALADGKGGRADRPPFFDWDRYHARQDACVEQDRIAAACAYGVDYCDELALRQATSDCSAFGRDSKSQ